MCARFGNLDFVAFIRLSFVSLVALNAELLLSILF
jgi:hypothetical protein